MNLVLTPLHADPYPLSSDGGERLWGVTSNDPAFLASVPEGAAPLLPGWYRASAVIDGRSGDVREPKLYIPDAEGHYTEERAVGMARNGRAFAAEFFIAQPVAAIRFDPSTTRCEFACGGLEVDSIAAPVKLKTVAAPGLAVVRRLASRLKRQASGLPPALDPEALRANRRDRVLASIDRKGEGVEIGPCHDPIAPKREGFRVEIIDHASAAELRAKYAGQGLTYERIEEVDHVWHGQSYAELTGKAGYYDWVIASHVIEHTPDLIAFLRDCETILKDTGVLSLVIPDKRFEFDRFRPITGLARVIDAHVAGHRIHTPGAAAEYLMNVVTRAGQLSWNPGDPGEYTFLHTSRQALDAMKSVTETGAYLDVHNWCFVPSSFRLLMADLHALGYTKMREVAFQPTQGWEFYITLGCSGAGPDRSRLEMLQAVDEELAASER